MAEDRTCVLICKKSGGWGLSKEALERYGCDESSGNDACRHDPKLVDLWKKMGTAFDGRHNWTQPRYLLSKYIDYYKINEYDGLETISINYEEYQIDRIQDMLDSENLKTDTSKMAAIRYILASPVESDWIVTEEHTEPMYVLK
jgi:hypothetical protein